MNSSIFRSAAFACVLSFAATAAAQLPSIPPEFKQFVPYGFLGGAEIAAPQDEVAPSDAPAEPVTITVEMPAQAEEPKADLPQPEDLRVIRTAEFELRIPHSDQFSRDEARDLVGEAVKYVESRFPKLKPFAAINQDYKVIVIVEKEIKTRIREAGNGAPARSRFEHLLGQCRTYDDELYLRVTSATLRDKETLVHELAHAILRGNEVNTCQLIDEGIARYVEDRDGKCPAVRNLLIEKGAPLKYDLVNMRSDCYSGACGWVIVKYLVEVKGMSLEDIAIMAWADVPEPREAFASFISWEMKPSVPPPVPMPPDPSSVTTASN